jgi:SAM-dependent methyltransferase
MRWCSDRIEGLASKSYQADLSRDLVALLPHASDPVLIANIPERQYLAPLLRRFATPFSGEQYVSLFRRDSIAFLEKGELITTSSKDLVILEIDAHRTKDFELYLRESKRVLREQGRLVVYLHRLGLVWPADEIAENSLAGVVDKLGAEFQVASIRRRGGLGSYLRVRLAAWFRALVSRRLAVRWLLIIFGLPLLPIIMVFGGIFVVATVVLDFFVRSARYWISSLILARNDSFPEGPSRI